MMARFSNRRLLDDRRGMSVVEFGLMAPVFMVLLMGVLDMGHTLYMQAVMQGAVQKAARDASLEMGTQQATQALIDNAVEAQVKRLAQSATVTFSRTNFRDYTKAANPTKEPFTDTNANGTCDKGEPFEDNNLSGLWDVDNGRTGQGSAKDSTIYAAQITYPRLFPFMKSVGLPADVTINATTVLVNQPYGDQAAVTVRNCP